MRKSVYLAAIAASIVTSASAAQAATVVTANPGAEGRMTFATASTLAEDPGDFSETFTITLLADGFLNFAFTEISFDDINALEFTSVSVDGVTVPNFVRFSGPDGEPDVISFRNLFVEAGLRTITVTGEQGGNGSFGGQGSFRVAAVPEPATWAMFLVGFGAVGYSMRSRKVSYKAVQAV